MKLILNKQESDLLQIYLHSPEKIKEINFEPSDIYVHNLALSITELVGNLGARKGYVIRKRKLYFLNDIDKFTQKLFRRR